MISFIGVAASEALREKLIHEPATVATNVALLLVSAWLGGLLVRLRSLAAQPAVAGFAGASLIVSAVGIVNGALTHALAIPDASPVWRLGLVLVAVSAALFAHAVIVVVVPPRFTKVLTALVDVACVAYCCAALLAQPDFALLLIYLVSLTIGMMLGTVISWKRAGCPAWFASGGLSLIGGGVQAARLAPSPAFDHNALFHVIQIASVCLLFYGARAAAAQPRRIA
jgi:hypothetical protein